MGCGYGWDACSCNAYICTHCAGLLLDQVEAENGNYDIGKNCCVSKYVRFNKLKKPNIFFLFEFALSFTLLIPLRQLFLAGA